MNHLPFNLVDIAVIGVLIISGLMAFSRGLVREVLSIGAWVGAAVVTIYAFPHLRVYARGYVKNELLADIATGVAIFVVTLFVCTAVSHMLARNVRSSGFGALDRSLGFLFGLARGAVLVCLAYLLFLWIVPKPEDQPDAIKQAKSLPLIDAGATLIQSAAAQRHHEEERPGRRCGQDRRRAADRPAGDRFPQPAGTEIGCDEDRSGI